ncbi:cysteate synthase [Streptomyces sp. NBS 14/10]|uniref:cysteate synthase n=1 Tax=Streptomyces sp. NBS 14/10 TaxID=1945643 RepID=UPI000B7FEB8E|nr:cysteate synthase [Streptomyces sp. NBS 14/10]KAK1184580.1 cysteate synthase [Streptomyces sp. NBS 14/10]NUS89915.1 cysteate synthase [Streptomyces sp.]
MGDIAVDVSGKRHYSLVCSCCGKQYADDGLMLTCPNGHEPALLQTEYTENNFTPVQEDEGIFRYRDWLPVVREIPGSARPAVFRSERLSRLVGLPDLWVAFNGYWPERGGLLETGTFKELEAYTVLGRLPKDPVVLVVASAGNTAAAFASVCSRYGQPCLLIVPEVGLGRLKLPEALHPSVRLVVLEDADYADAIALSEAVAKLTGFQLEGGVRNVGRRDGLATVMYSAVEAMGELPDFYFQAVGSAAGGIAVHEAAKRLMAAGAPSNASAASKEALPRLFLSQNESFAPIHRAWQAGQRFLVRGSVEDDKRAVRRAFADELTNRFPPYAVHSGVYDVLVESDGDVLAVDGESARAARDMFSDIESIDIEPASAVAAASLLSAVRGGRIPRDASVLLNVTGGGRARMARDHSPIQAEPSLRIASLGSLEEAVDQIAGLFSVELQIS